MKMLGRFILVWVLGTVAGLLWLGFIAGTAPGVRAEGPSPGDWYRSLIQPGTGASCCDISDCAPATARLTASGWVVVTKEGRALPVPPAVILPDVEPLDGISAYACIFGGRVRCFVRPGSGG